MELAEKPDKPEDQEKSEKNETEDMIEKIERFATLNKFVVHPASVQLLPQTFCLRNHIVILEVVNPESFDPITLGMLNPQNYELVQSISDRFNRPIKSVKLNQYEIARALNKGFAREEEDDRSVDVTEKVETIDPRVIEQVNRVINDGIMRKASDIHIERHLTGMLIRYRIDGMLYNSSTMVPRDLEDHFISRLKIMSDLDISEKRLAQFGQASVIVKRAKRKVTVNLRISTIPGLYGEEASVRILDPFTIILDLESLGFQTEVLRQYREVINDPQGLLLVTGPTGSGKTTTLYSTLHEMKSQYVKMLTAEDPVEFNIEGISQKQISKVMGFSDLGRAFLRMDPDILLIGEIRDEETASIAIRAAQTGHLVLSTLHTNEAVMSISRLIHLKVDPHYISTSLIGALAQRLVRKICPKCKTETTLDNNVKKFLPESFTKQKFYKGEGCINCRELGFQGRTGLYELLVMNEEIADMIATGQSDYHIRQYAREHGMKTISHDALEKVLQGVTSLEEALRIVPARHLVKIFEETGSFNS